MGLERRKKSDKLFAGSKLNVPGQGIATVKKFSGAEKISIGSLNDRPPGRPTQTPTPSVTPTPTPTPTPISNCLLAQENLDNILTENGNFILIDCP